MVIKIEIKYEILFQKKTFEHKTVIDIKYVICRPDIASICDKFAFLKFSFILSSIKLVFPNNKAIITLETS